VRISGTGVTLETPIGVTDVTFRKSRASAYRSSYRPDKFVTFTSNRYRYAISYPRDSVWIEPAALGRHWQQKIESVRGYSNAIIAPGQGDFAAMVIVRVYPAGGLTIQQALLGFQQAAGAGVVYEPPTIDLSTNSATLPGYDQKLNKIMVSRVSIVDGWLYDLRAAISPDVSNEIRNEVNLIVNSFHMLS